MAESKLAPDDERIMEDDLASKPGVIGVTVVLEDKMIGDDEADEASRAAR